MSIKENIAKVRARIAAAAQRAGRDPAEIKLVAVVKNVPLEQIFAALDAGLTEIGENRVQQAAGRVKTIREKYPNTVVHMIGHLQRNKVRQALDTFDIIQSLDSERLARELSEKTGKRIVPVLIEVNVSGEASKYGLPAAGVSGLIAAISGFKNLKIEGFMTIAPLTGDPRTVRPYFHQLKQISAKFPHFNTLSMGMSDDFEAAIAEGATLVRIGRAIFQGA